MSKLVSSRLWATLFATPLLALLAIPVSGQDSFDPTTLDPTSEGPWSDIEKTTLTVPMVVDGSIALDGSPSTGEYGGFSGVTVTPGDNAWNLDWPPDRSWDGPDDSSFTFYLAHDTDFLYVGVDAKDDIVTSDDPNAAFWRDDAIEIVVDALNDRYDVNTDQSNDRYGGHAYANFEGRFSAWNDELGEIGNTLWSSDVDWTYGPPDEDNDVAGFGEPTETGWNMEMRFKKRLFEDPDVGNKLEEGYVMGFNIAMDDDDQRGTGPDGSGEREQDLELQYFWANRARPIGWNEDESFFYTEEEIETRFYEQDYDFAIDSGGRLTHGGTGEIIFGGMSGLAGDFDGDGEITAGDVDLLCAEVIAATNPAAFDLNGDGGVDSNDVTALLESAGKLNGDADFDGAVQFSDFAELAGNFSQTDAHWSQGDFDCSGDVQFADFAILANNFGQSGGEVAAAVPEPMASILALAGVVALLPFRQRSRRSVDTTN